MIDHNNDNYNQRKYVKRNKLIQFNNKLQMSYMI